MATGLGRNTSVISIKVVSKASEALNGAMAAALSSNSTLQELSFERLPSNAISVALVGWSSIFAALGRNTQCMLSAR
jgi:hypothetical protein